MPPRWTSELDLLCEACGYPLAGLPPEAVCPECGKPIADSLPTRRTGTPWQQRPTARALLRTWWTTLRHPRRTLDTMSLDDPLNERYRNITAACAVGLLALAAVPFILATLDLPTITLAVIILPLLWLAGVGIVLVLTAIEEFGLGFLGRRRNFRITGRLALAIVAHASVGWVVAAACLTLGLALLAVGALAGLAAAYGNTRPQPSLVAETLLIAGALTATLGPLAGFLFFETFAYLGLRRCRYANHPAAAPVPSNPEPRAKSPEQQ